MDSGVLVEEHDRSNSVPPLLAGTGLTVSIVSPTSPRIWPVRLALIGCYSHKDENAMVAVMSKQALSGIGAGAAHQYLMNFYGDDGFARIWAGKALTDTSMGATP
jgi:hypothetical protein